MRGEGAELCLEPGAEPAQALLGTPRYAAAPELRLQPGEALLQELLAVLEAAPPDRAPEPGIAHQAPYAPELRVQAPAARAAERARCRDELAPALGAAQAGSGARGGARFSRDGWRYGWL